LAAIAAKTQVKTRAKHAAQETLVGVKGRVSAGASEVRSGAAGWWQRLRGLPARSRLSVLAVSAGALASLVTRKVWLWISDEDEMPDADDTDNGWLELLAGAGLEAAVFAVAKASATRLQAEGIRHAVEADKIRRNDI
jgi:hypothetical protein